MVRPDIVDDHFPPLTTQLVEALQARFPSRLPRPEDTERQDLFRAGQASVVEFLAQELEEQSNHMLETR